MNEQLFEKAVAGLNRISGGLANEFIKLKPGSLYDFRDKVLGSYKFNSFSIEGVDALCSVLKYLSLLDKSKDSPD